MFDFSFEKQARSIAVIEIVVAVIGLVATISVTVIVTTNDDTPSQQEAKDFITSIINYPVGEKVTLIVIPIIYFIGELCLALWLYTSINKRNYKRCRIWYIITITICMTGLYFFIPVVVFSDDSIFMTTAFLLSYSFTAYSVWVVNGFIQELKSEGLHQPIPHCVEFYN